MRENISNSTIDYLNARKGVITARFIWLIAKNRVDGMQETVGFSNLPYNVTIDVVSGQTGTVVSRDYIGAGSLISTSDINLVSDLTIQTVRVTLSQTNAAVNNAIRGYDARNAGLEIHFGLFDIDSRKLVDTPYPHFVGFINKAPVKRPKIGGTGGVTIEAHSRTRELTIANPSVKSDEYQKSMFPNDDFRKQSGVASLWDTWWGEKKKGQS